MQSISRHVPKIKNKNLSFYSYVHSTYTTASVVYIKCPLNRSVKITEVEQTAASRDIFSFFVYHSFVLVDMLLDQRLVGFRELVSAAFYKLAVLKV